MYPQGDTGGDVPGRKEGMDMEIKILGHGCANCANLEKAARAAAARRVANVLGAERHIILPLDLLAFGGSALTDDIDVPKSGVGNDIPVTYVPARNLVFLALTTAFAETSDSRDIFTEGFSSPGLKLVEGGEMNTDIMDTFLNMVRAPEAAKLVRALESHDVAIADRFAGVEEGGTSQPPLRKLISKGSRLWVRWFLGLPFADTQCGAKAFRTAAWRRVAPRVTERGWAFDVDVLAHVQASGKSGKPHSHGRPG